MKNKKKSPESEDHRTPAIKAVCVGIVYGVPLFIKMGVTYLRFKRRAKKAGKIFKAQLLEAGLEPEDAKVLTEQYLSTSHFISAMVRSVDEARRPGFS